MWPASMLAKSLTESEISRMKIEMNSIAAMNGTIAFGTSGIRLLMYLRTPL